MKLLVLERRRFVVAAYFYEDADGEQCVQAIDDLMSFGSQYQASAKGTKALFKTYAENGKGRPFGITNEQMHHANYDPDILEFIKGKVRVFCFQDEDILVLTNAGLKKGQKANPKDVSMAIKVRDQYFADKERKNLQFEER